MPPKRNRNRCSYREGSRRCPYNGTGDPVLCDPHRIAVIDAARTRRPTEVIAEAFSNWMSGRPVNMDATIVAAESFASQFLRAPQQPQPQMPGARPPRPAARPHQERPPPDPDADALAAARTAARAELGFTESERLTEQQIKDRKRVLAKRFHPDRPNGSATKMARINDAADVLLAALAT